MSIQNFICITVGRFKEVTAKMISYSLSKQTTKKNGKAGNTYYNVQFRVPTADGKKKNVHKSTHVRADEKNAYAKANKIARQIVAEYEDLTYSDFTQMTLDKYMADYLERLRPEIKATTYDNYVSMFNRHIKPFFRDLRLKIGDIKPMHITRYINAKKSEVSVNTVIKQFRLISQCMQDAVINDVIRKNPCSKVKKPEKEPFEHSCYTAEEARRLLSAVYGTVMEKPVFLSAMFGLRRSEVVGLKWENIDWENKTLEICGTITRAKQADGSIKDVYSKSLKTRSSHRFFPLDETAFNYLYELHERSKSIISNCNDYKTFICVNEVGELLKVDYVTHKFSQMLEANGLRHIRFHDLRHTCISYLAENVQMKQVQEYAGHANYNLTADTYSHVSYDTKLKDTAIITNGLGIDNYIKDQYNKSATDPYNKPPVKSA